MRDKTRKIDWRTGLIMGVSVLAYALLLHVTGIGCPIRFLTGVSCPGCGMTRACLSAAQLDFVQAFRYHPLWPLVLTAPFLLFAPKPLFGRHKIESALVACGAALLIAVYVVRLCLGDPVVAPDLKSGILVRLFRGG